MANIDYSLISITLFMIHYLVYPQKSWKINEGYKNKHVKKYVWSYNLCCLNEYALNFDEPFFWIFLLENIKQTILPCAPDIHTARIPCFFDVVIQFVSFLCDSKELCFTVNFQRDIHLNELSNKLAHNFF
jgi:hypothetical protein